MNSETKENAVWQFHCIQFVLPKEKRSLFDKGNEIETMMKRANLEHGASSFSQITYFDDDRVDTIVAAVEAFVPGTLFSDIECLLRSEYWLKHAKEGSLWQYFSMPHAVDACGNFELQVSTQRWLPSEDPHLQSALDDGKLLPTQYQPLLTPLIHYAKLLVQRWAAEIPPVWETWRQEHNAESEFALIVDTEAKDRVMQITWRFTLTHTELPAGEKELAALSQFMYDMRFKKGIWLSVDQEPIYTGKYFIMKYSVEENPEDLLQAIYSLELALERYKPTLLPLHNTLT